MIKPNIFSIAWRIRVVISSALFAFVGCPIFVLGVIYGYNENYTLMFVCIGILAFIIMFGLYLTGMLKKLMLR